MHQIDYKRIVRDLTVVLAVAAIVLSVYGGQLAYRPKDVAGWLDIVYQTFKYFKLNDHAPENVWLAWARVLAPLATFSVLLQVVLEYFGSHVTRWSNRNLRDHIVVCGLGSKGMAFIENIRKGADRRRPIVAIEPDPSDAQVNFGRHHGVRLVRGDAMLDATHLDASTHHAAYAVIATGSDDRNLRVATRLCESVTGRTMTNRLRVFASIADPGLWNELSNSAAIRRLWNGAELIPFSLPLLAARAFFWTHPLYTYADLRGEDRLHVVFAGFGEYAASLLVQMLRACVYKNFKLPRATVLVTGAPDVRARFERRLGGLLKDEPGLGPVLEIDFIEFDLAKTALGHVQMADIERSAAVSAVVIEQPTPERTLAVTLVIRDAMRLADRWRAPVFVRSDTNGLSAIFTDETKTSRFDEVIVPFGADAGLCDVAVIEGEMEQLAQRIHGRYQNTRAGLLEADPQGARAASARDWAALPETYRQASRRAADHVKAKLASANLYVPPGFNLRAPESVRLGDEMIEQLSKLEHLTWTIERRIDGWTPHSWRDDMRKHHDNLVAYEVLSEEIKNYDRDQIHLIDGHVLERVKAHRGDTSLVREDHWIGLIGANVIDESQAAWMAQVLREDVLPSLIARHGDALFTLITPLAPGSDTVLTRAALAFFAEAGHVHRLIVVEGVPAGLMLGDYGRVMKPGLASGYPATASLEDIAALRSSMIAQTGGVGVRLSGWRVDLSDPARDYRGDDAARRAGYAAAGDYVAVRAATLIAACDLSAPRKPGGTIDTLGRRKDLLLVPRAWPPCGVYSTMTLDIAARTVSDKLDDVREKIAQAI